MVILFVLPLYFSPPAKTAEQARLSFRERLSLWLSAPSAWLPLNPWQAILMGVILGATGFWNGAVVITTLLILFVMTWFSRHRLEYLIIAVLTMGLSWWQKDFFVGPGIQAFNPRYHPGLFSPGPDWHVILQYFVEAFGFWLVAFPAALFFVPRGRRALFIAFAAPFVAASFVAFSMDIMNNHKFVQTSMMLLDIAIAFMLVRLFLWRRLFTKAVAVVLLVLLTLSGWVDAFSFINLNKRYYEFATDDPMYLWVKENTGPRRLFLTSHIVWHPVLFAGRRLFLGWAYFPWAAGYDTRTREDLVKAIYGGTDFETVDRLIRENHIDYIMIDDGNRNADAYHLNEALFREHYPIIYDNPEQKTVIFQAHPFTNK